MRKLKLDVDALVVDSFRTAAAGGEGGTVRGAELDLRRLEPQPVETIGTCPTHCDQATCGVTCHTCWDPTCDSCYATGCRTGISPECCG